MHKFCLHAGVLLLLPRERPVPITSRSRLERPCVAVVQSSTGDALTMKGLHIINPYEKCGHIDSPFAKKEISMLQGPEMDWRGVDFRGRHSQEEVVQRKRHISLIKKYVRDIVWGQDFAPHLICAGIRYDAISSCKRRVT